MRYWIYWNDLVQGPFEVEELVSLRAFSEDLPVCMEDRQDWVPAARVADLSPAIEQLRARQVPPPPPPPPPHGAPDATPLQGELFSEPEAQQHLFNSEDEPKGPYAFAPVTPSDAPSSGGVMTVTMPIRFALPRVVLPVVKPDLPKPRITVIPRRVIKESPVPEMEVEESKEPEAAPAVSFGLAPDDVAEAPATRPFVDSMAREPAPVQRRLEWSPLVLGALVMLLILGSLSYKLIDVYSTHAAIAEANRMSARHSASPSGSVAGASIPEAADQYSSLSQKIPLTSAQSASRASEASGVSGSSMSRHPSRGGWMSSTLRSLAALVPGFKAAPAAGGASVPLSAADSSQVAHQTSSLSNGKIPLSPPLSKGDANAPSATGMQAMTSGSQVVSGAQVEPHSQSNGTSAGSASRASQSTGWSGKLASALQSLKAMIPGMKAAPVGVPVSVPAGVSVPIPASGSQAVDQPSSLWKREAGRDFANGKIPLSPPLSKGGVNAPSATGMQAMTSGSRAASGRHSKNARHSHAAAKLPSWATVSEYSGMKKSQAASKHAAKTGKKSTKAAASAAVSAASSGGAEGMPGESSIGNTNPSSANGSAARTASAAAKRAAADSERSAAFSGTGSASASGHAAGNASGSLPLGSATSAGAALAAGAAGSVLPGVGSAAVGAKAAEASMAASAASSGASAAASLLKLPGVIAGGAASSAGAAAKAAPGSASSAKAVASAEAGTPANVALGQSAATSPQSSEAAIPAVDNLPASPASPAKPDPWANRQMEAISFVMKYKIPGGPRPIGAQAKVILEDMHEKELLHAAETGERLYLPDKLSTAALRETGSVYRVYLNFMAWQANGERVQYRSYQFEVDLAKHRLSTDDDAARQDFMTVKTLLVHHHSPKADDIEAVLSAVDHVNKHKMQAIIVKKNRHNRDEIKTMEATLAAAQAKLDGNLAFFRTRYPDKELKNVAHAYDFTPLLSAPPAKK